MRSDREGRTAPASRVGPANHHGEDGMRTRTVGVRVGRSGRLPASDARRRGRGRTGAGLAAALLVGLGLQPAAAAAQGTTAGGGAGEEPTRVLGMEDVVRRALEESRDVRAARLSLDEADDRVSEAWGEIYPSVDFNASYTRNVSPNVNFLPAIFVDPDAGPDEFVPVQFAADNQWSSTIAVEQPLFSASAFLGVGAAGRFETLQREVYRGTTQGVVTQVRQAYYDLLLAQEQRRLTARSLERVRESLEETRALNRAGLASDYDVLRLEVEVANLEPNLRQAENSVRQARRSLAVELDFPETERLAVEGSLATIDLLDPAANSRENRTILSFFGFEPPEENLVEEALSTMAERRSDLRQLELTESLRHTEMRLEQVEYLPRISLFGTYLITAQENGSPDFFASGDGQRAYARNVGVRVSVPIFQGFQRDARVDQRRAALRQAQTESRLATDRARAQVRTLVETVQEALLRARGQKLAVQQAQRGFEIASAQYREGLSGQLELTDAEVALRQSEFNYAQAAYDYLVARARLDEATGSVPLIDIPVPGLEEGTGS